MGVTGTGANVYYQMWYSRFSSLSFNVFPCPFEKKGRINSNVNKMLEQFCYISEIRVVLFFP